MKKIGILLVTFLITALGLYFALRFFGENTFLVEYHNDVSGTYAEDKDRGVSSDWETCRNEEYGYEFSYPQGWHIYQIQTDGEDPYPVEVGSCQGRIITLSQDVSVRGGFFPPIIRSIWMTDDRWAGSLEEFLQTLSTELFPIDILKRDRINGVEIIHYTRQDSLHVAFLKDGGVLDISVDAKNQEDQSKLFDMILPTVTFFE